MWFAEVEPLGNGALATIDLPTRHYRNYYEGFANSALWPALHSRPDLIRADHDDCGAYREVNVAWSRLRCDGCADAPIWVHDYHFLTLAAELRRAGVESQIGFFLHTPFPVRSAFVGVPHHRDLVQAMLHYDLIGFQTDDDQSICRLRARRAGNGGGRRKPRCRYQYPPRQLPDRHRRYGLRRGCAQGGRPPRYCAPACQPAGEPAGDRRRSHRLFERAGEQAARLRSAVANRPLAQAAAFTAADRIALARRHPDLREAARQAGGTGG